MPIIEAIKLLETINQLSRKEGRGSMPQALVSEVSPKQSGYPPQRGEVDVQR